VIQNYIDDLGHALLNLDRVGAKRISIQATQDLPAPEFVEKVLVPALEKIGNGWEDGSIALSQVYMSGKICEGLVQNILIDQLPKWENQPKIAIAVFEDFHMLGKRIVHSSMLAHGFDIIDYGRVNTADLLQRIIIDNTRIVLLSTLMLPSALRIKDFMTKLDSSVKVIVGGAPFRFDEHLWKDIGADAVGKNAADAVSIVSKMIGDLK
jgi:methanogenic corrinoid protein MtbC1